MTLYITVTKNFGKGANSSKSGAINGGNGNGLSSCACSSVSSGAKKVSTIASSLGKTKTTKKVSSKIASGVIDKRVSLTASPRTSNTTNQKFVDKVKYVLGTEYYTKKNLSWLKSGAKFYGLLRNALGSSSGLIFPYTPSIDFQHIVNYESVDILHTNLSYNYYKNTQPPTIGLSAKFTADNRDNALHMLSAIWFLIACSKCEFGENSSLPGLPPPTLYLSGYDNLIDNIPVIIKSVSYKYPEDKHYINLVLDMSKNYDDGESFCTIYETQTTSTTSNVNKNVVDKNPKVTTTDNGIRMSFWLPTELTISLQLAVQPNLLKTKKQWSLDAYKTGLLLHNKGKNPSAIIRELACADKKVNTTTKELMMSGLTSDGQMGDMYSTTLDSIEYTFKYDEKAIEFIPSGWTW